MRSSSSGSAAWTNLWHPGVRRRPHDVAGHRLFRLTTDGPPGPVDQVPLLFRETSTDLDKTLVSVTTATSRKSARLHAKKQRERAVLQR